SLRRDQSSQLPQFSGLRLGQPRPREWAKRWKSPSFLRALMSSISISHKLDTFLAGRTSKYLGITFDLQVSSIKHGMTRECVFGISQTPSSRARWVTIFLPDTNLKALSVAIRGRPSRILER